MPHKPIWTPEREALLQEMVKRKPRPTVRAMSEELGLSYYAVAHHTERMQLGRLKRPNWVWTSDREARLREMVAQKPRPRLKAMAAEFRLTRHAVSHHIAKLGLGQQKWNSQKKRRDKLAAEPKIEPTYYGRAPTLPPLASLQVEA